MITIKLKSWTVEYDPETTRNYYKSYRFITDGCSCLFCRNYVEAIRTLPQGILDFFDRFGIDPRKEGEVSEYYEDEDGTHLYGGFYHIVGRILDGPDCWITSGDDTISNAYLSDDLIEIDGFTFGFTYGLSLVPDTFPSPALQVEFQGKLPWVLPEKW
ncbi:hypothetical protein [Paenibacillus sp. FSL K6-1566]|uniref:hypothetical protein n=1 Tax=unclassified Paenibacillus TaxID=185978 RepID=UPI001B088BA1|nr:hypothetical protein J31TS3_22340 [Paenibacillus lactis]